MYEQFFSMLVKNRFTFKLKELARIKKEKKEINILQEEKLDNLIDNNLVELKVS